MVGQFHEHQVSFEFPADEEADEESANGEHEFGRSDVQYSKKERGVGGDDAQHDNSRADQGFPSARYPVFLVKVDGDDLHQGDGGSESGKR